MTECISPWILNWTSTWAPCLWAAGSHDPTSSSRGRTDLSKGSFTPWCGNWLRDGTWASSGNHIGEFSQSFSILLNDLLQWSEAHDSCGTPSDLSEEQADTLRGTWDRTIAWNKNSSLLYPSAFSDWNWHFFLLIKPLRIGFSVTCWWNQPTDTDHDKMHQLQLLAVGIQWQIQNNPFLMK